MAERRMFAKTIIDSDTFLDMPLSAQALYFHLSMRADDDGFVNNPKKIQRMIGASDDDCRLLIMKKYVLTFESGVIVIRHWKIHNYIQKDRYKETVYLDEKEHLALDQNNAYTECIHNVSTLDTQDSIGKVSMESKYVSKEKEITNHQRAPAHACESYEDIMDDMALEDGVRPTLWEFIKHCQINGHTLTNARLTNILVDMDMRRCGTQEKVELLQNAINGGYYDIKRGKK